MEIRYSRGAGCMDVLDKGLGFGEIEVSLNTFNALIHAVETAMDTNQTLLYAGHPLFDVVRIIGDRVDPLTNVAQMLKHKIVGFASHGVVFLLCFPRAVS